MKEIIGFIKAYYHEVNKPALLVCTLYTAALVWLNYGYALEERLIYETGLPANVFTGHLLIYMSAFLVPCFIALWPGLRRLGPGFWFCMILAPVIFAVKVSMNTTVAFASDPSWYDYWNQIIYWPLRMLVLLAILAACYLLFHGREKHLYGLRPDRFNLRPYLVMLVIMVPLIGAASTQPDFLAVYPKMNQILPLPGGAVPSWLYRLLFELSYGSDFFSIEIFFRGFLVIGLSRWIGRDAILPMACFYCSIHFGKPMGECISSFFGGLLLGIISYNTRSVYGGLIVHLGIAWLMEIGGYLGGRFLN